MDDIVTTYEIGNATVRIHGGPLDPEKLKPIFARFMEGVYQDRRRAAQAKATESAEPNGEDDRAG